MPNRLADKLRMLFFRRSGDIGTVRSRGELLGHAAALPRLACGDARVGDRGYFVGTVRASAEPLRAPISGAPCALIRVMRAHYPPFHGVEDVLEPLEAAVDFVLEDATGAIAVDARLGVSLVAAGARVILQQTCDDLDRLRATAQMSPTERELAFPAPAETINAAAAAVSLTPFFSDVNNPGTEYVEHNIAIGATVIVIGAVVAGDGAVLPEHDSGYRTTTVARVLGPAPDAFSLYVAEAPDALVAPPRTRA